MDLFTILFIALGLSMDSLAVSIASGIALKKFLLWNTIKISFFFALFQGLMPVIGWYIGTGFKEYITELDHWIAFGLLVFLGLKLIHEGRKHEDDKKEFNPCKLTIILILALATSVDALAVGISFAFLDVDIFFPSLIIGIVTFIFSFAGVVLGVKFGRKYDFKIELIGGLILIAIGTKILLEHTVFS